MCRFPFPVGTCSCTEGAMWKKYLHPIMLDLHMYCEHVNGLMTMTENLHYDRRNMSPFHPAKDRYFSIIIVGYGDYVHM